MLTSSNYNKDEEKTVGGKNGYGAKLANIFSKKFTVETVDSINKKKYVQEYSNNMSDKTKAYKLLNLQDNPIQKLHLNLNLKDLIWKVLIMIL